MTSRIQEDERKVMVDASTNTSLAAASGAVQHVWKLLVRKHSSGDLHSRLKTRKLLGVGETDDGDVHRSKLSQILGHSEQLYIRLPRGLRLWQFLTALMFSVIGLWALMFPRNLFAFALTDTASSDTTLPIRLYGAALLSFSIVFWSTLQSQDKDVIRWSLLASSLYFTVQFIAVLITTATYLISVQGFFLVVCPLTSVAPTLFFYSVVLPKHQYSRH